MWDHGCRENVSSEGFDGDVNHALSNAPSQARATVNLEENKGDHTRIEHEGSAVSEFLHCVFCPIFYSLDSTNIEGMSRVLVRQTFVRLGTCGTSS